MGRPGLGCSRMGGPGTVRLQAPWRASSPGQIPPLLAGSAALRRKLTARSPAFLAPMPQRVTQPCWALRPQERGGHPDAGL